MLMHWEMILMRREMILIHCDVDAHSTQPSLTDAFSRNRPAEPSFRIDVAAAFAD